MYITNSNLNKLTQRIAVHPSELLKLPNIEKFISQADLIFLTQAYKLYTQQQTVTITTLQILPEPIDTGQWLYEGIHPAYHSNKDCQKLKNDYQNLYIPAEIQARGEQEVKRFRSYFNKIPPREWCDPATRRAAQAEFGFSDKHFTTATIQNSGKTRFDISSISIEDLHRILNETIHKMRTFPTLSAEHQKIFSFVTGSLVISSD